MRSPLQLFAAALTLTVVACGSTPDVGSGDFGGMSGGDDTTAAPEGEGGDTGDVGDDTLVPLQGADDSSTVPSSTPETLTATTTSVKATGDVNMRSGAGTTFAILAVIPEGTIVTLVTATPNNGWLNVKFNGQTGWSSGKYFEDAGTANTSPGGTSTPGGGVTDPDGPASPANAIARAQASVGFSYWWGGGAWSSAGATSSNKGTCSGNCPSCSHKGSYGADCSGMVAKAWHFGDDDLTSNSHPYSSASFISSLSGHWSIVDRGTLKAGDAMAYNSGGSGHVIMYEKGDGWGSPTVYECRGCAYGCVHDTRSFTSSYKGSRRSGF